MTETARTAIATKKNEHCDGDRCRPTNSRVCECTCPCANCKVARLTPAEAYELAIKRVVAWHRACANDMNRGFDEIAAHSRIADEIETIHKSRA